jgi:Protein of unknown function (DUF1570)
MLRSPTNFLRTTASAVLTAVLALGILTTEAAAQGGYKKIKLDTIGVELPVANHYEALPTEPTEEWIVSQWVLKQSKTREPEKDKDFPEFIQREVFRPRLEMVWIDHVAEAANPTTGGDNPPPPPPPGPGGEEPPAEEEGGAGDEDENPFSRFNINTLERYLELARSDVWRLGKGEEQKEIDKTNTATLYRLEPGENGRFVEGLMGWAFVVKSSKRTIAFIGQCEEPEWKEHTKIWEEMASKIEFFEPDSKNADKLREYYAKRPQFVDPEYRIKIIQDLVRGWKYEDTENYIFIYNTKDQTLLRKLMKDIEAIRGVYLEMFPPAVPMTAVSTVRICRDLEEYHQYGGPQGSGGYWNSVAKELVFFDYEDVKGEGRGSGKEDTLIVLYHEAFHQYIYYSTGELPPHSWYNEGTGDYFSGAKISGGKFKGIDVNTWRIEFIQEVIRAKKYVPWQQITRYEQRQYYANPGVCYAQGWSMIYFLRESKEAQNHPVWSKILDIYFNVLKEEYLKEIAALGEDPAEFAKYAAGEKARKVAVEKAFEGVDYFEIEEAWKSFTLGLKVPR